MTAKRPPRRGGAGTPKPRAARRDAIVVTDEERQHLIEDVAYFRAERYRRVEPGQYREEDRREVEAEIEAILKRCRKR